VTVTYTFDIHKVCHGVNQCVKKCELFLIKPSVKVSRVYYWDIYYFSMQHVMHDNFVFQQENTPVHCAHNTVQLLQCKILDFLCYELWPTQRPRVKPHWYLWIHTTQI